MVGQTKRPSARQVCDWVLLVLDYSVSRSLASWLRKALSFPTRGQSKGEDHVQAVLPNSISAIVSFSLIRILSNEWSACWYQNYLVALKLNLRLGSHPMYAWWVHGRPTGSALPLGCLISLPSHSALSSRGSPLVIICTNLINSQTMHAITSPDLANPLLSFIFLVVGQSMAMQLG